MKKLIQNRGFTLIEVIIVLAVISILASMLVPIAVRNIDDARLTAAAKDTQSIATAIVNFHIDARPYWPAYSTNANFTNKNPDVYILETKDGNVPTATNNGYWISSFKHDTLENQLLLNNPDYPTTAWKGPYLGTIKEDPWGYRYYVSIGSLWDGSWGAAGADPAQAWVISAGPNGNIDTDPKGPLNSDPTPSPGDDIGFLVSSYSQ